MNKQYLMVGGPWDGRIIAMPPGHDVINGPGGLYVKTNLSPGVEVYTHIAHLAEKRRSESRSRWDKKRTRVDFTRQKVAQ